MFCVIAKHTYIITKEQFMVNHFLHNFGSIAHFIGPVPYWYSGLPVPRDQKCVQYQQSLLKQ